MLQCTSQWNSFNTKKLFIKLTPKITDTYGRGGHWTAGRYPIQDDYITKEGSGFPALMSPLDVSMKFTQPIRQKTLWVSIVDIDRYMVDETLLWYPMFSCMTSYIPLCPLSLKVKGGQECCASINKRKVLVCNHNTIHLNHKCT